MKIRNVLLALAILALPSLCWAQEPVEYPLLSAKRAVLAAGASYEFYSAEGSEALPAFGKEWVVGLYGAYRIVPKLAVAGSMAYGFDNEWLRTSIGPRYTFYSGALDLGLGLQYEWLNPKGDEPAPSFDKEWISGLFAGYGIYDWLFAAGSTVYQLDNKQVRTALGVRIRLFEGHP